jgi:hypothetical protein
VLAGETYFEACRLIRVDGIFDVAADLSNDAYNLLETASDATSPTPSEAGKTAYENFVLDYLQNRYVSGTAYNSRVSPTASQMAPLDVPASITIARSDDQRWLHSRGLYVDYLEQEARDAIVDAKAACRNNTGGDPSAADLRTCVLKVLPFTSINLTEVADWASSSTAQIMVTNNNFSAADDTTNNDPVRGGVTPGTSPSNNAQANAITVAGHSTSGLLGLLNTWPINSEEDPYTSPVSTLAQRDTQLFEISGGSSGNNGGLFTVNFAAGFQPNSQPPVISVGLAVRQTCEGANGGMSHSCPTQGGSVPLRVENYTTTGEDLRANPCRTDRNITMRYRIAYDVISITSGNAASTVGSLNVVNNNVPGGYPTGEYTQTTVNPAADGDVLTVTMSSPTFLCPSAPVCRGNTPDYSNSTYTMCLNNQRPDGAPFNQ